MNEDMGMAGKSASYLHIAYSIFLCSQHHYSTCIYRDCAYMYFQILFVLLAVKTNSTQIILLCQTISLLPLLTPYHYVLIHHLH